MGPATAAIEALRLHSLPTLVERAVEAVILDGELAPGDKINEKDLATRFGISRGPVREALRSLDRAGLIASVPNRGVFVRTLTAAEADEIYDVRAALFALAGRLVAERATPSLVARLRGHVAEMDGALRADEFPRYVLVNFAFHEAIVRGAGNATLANQYLTLIKQLRLYRTRNLMLASSMRASNEEHRAMVEAIAAGDPDRSDAAHRAHVATAKGRLLAAHIPSGPSREDHP